MLFNSSILIFISQSKTSRSEEDMIDNPQSVPEKIMHAKRIFACPCSSDESLCTICKAEKKYPIIIKACDCQVHEKCLRETIQADLTQSSRISTKYPDYQEYKCPTCSKTILYKEGFPRSGVPCSQINCGQKIFIVLFIMSILGFIGFLALDIWTYLHHGELKFPASVLAFITMIVSIVQIYYILTNIFYFVAEKEESAPASDREMIKT